MVEENMLVFKNYKPLSDSTLEAKIVDSEQSAEARNMHASQIEDLEKLYKKRMNKSIKQLGKIEEDPSRYLTASKEHENADL